MATDDCTRSITLPAAADLSTKQYKFGVINASGKVAVCGDGAQADGIIYNKPSAADQPTRLVIPDGALAKVMCGGDISAGDDVASDANGDAVEAATADDFILGTATEAGSDGAIIRIQFLRGGGIVPGA